MAKKKRGFKAPPALTKEDHKNDPEDPLKPARPSKPTAKGWTASFLSRVNELSNWQAALVIALIGFSVYFTGLTNPFQGDDFQQITNNTYVHSINNIGLFFDGGTFYNDGADAPLTGAYYRPLMTTVFSLIYTVFGAHPVYFHLAQLMFFIGSAIVLYLFFRYSFSPVLALLLSLIFLVHPVNSQVAFAIPSMQDALCFFFGILALYLLLRHESTKSLAAVTLSLFLALISKESGVVFIIISALYLLWFDRTRLYAFIGMITLPVVLWLALKVHAVGLLGANPNNAPIQRLDIGGRLLTAPSIILFFIIKFVWPRSLATAYYWVHPSLNFQTFLLPLLLDILLLAVVVYFGIIIRRRSSKAMLYTYLFFAAWATLGLALTIQVIPLDMTACETWFYISMAGVLGMIGTALRVIPKTIPSKALVVFSCLLIVALGTRSAFRGLDYASADKLARDNIANSKEDYVAYDQLASELVVQGKATEAKPYVDRSIDIYPTATNYNILGAVLTIQGDYAGAMKAYKSGLRYGDFILIYEGLGKLTMVTGDRASNERFLLSSVEKYPHDSKLWMYLAVLEARYKDSADARSAISKAAQYGQVPKQIYDSIINGTPLTLQVSPTNSFTIN